LDFGKGKVPYTITEAIKIFEIGMANSKNNRSVGFWHDIERAGIIPKRTAESMRSFFKTYATKGLEEYIRYALENDLRFCHAFARIPRVKSETINSVSE
jgi:hypothetical protein